MIPMIHERRLKKILRIDGPLSTCVADVEARLNELRGSSVTMEALLRRAPSNWYIEAREAKAWGLVEDVI